MQSNLLKCRYLFVTFWIISDSSCASPKVSTRHKLEKITDCICTEKGSQTVQASDFNLNFNAQEGEDFVKALKVEDLEWRNNSKLYTTRDRTTIVSIFWNKTKKQAYAWEHIVTIWHWLVKFQ